MSVFGSYFLFGGELCNGFPKVSVGELSQSMEEQCYAPWVLLQRIIWPPAYCELILSSITVSLFTSGWGKTRHQRGDTFHLTLDEILDETKLLDIGMKQKMWLMNEVTDP